MGIWIDLTQLPQIIASFITITFGIYVTANFVKAWWHKQDGDDQSDTEN